MSFRNYKEAVEAGHKPPFGALIARYNFNGEERKAVVWYDTELRAWRAQDGAVAFSHDTASVGFTPDDAVDQLEIRAFPMTNSPWASGDPQNVSVKKSQARVDEFRALATVEEMTERYEEFRFDIEFLAASHATRMRDDFRTWEGRMPMVGDDERELPSCENRALRVSRLASVARVAPSRYLATYQMGNRRFHGVGSKADLALVDLESSFSKMMSGEMTTNYTVVLSNGEIVPAAWAPAFADPSLKGVTHYVESRTEH